MEALKNGIELTGTLYTSAQGDAKDKLAYAEQIWDDEQQKHQSEINKELAKNITDIPAADEEDITVTSDNKLQLKDRDSSKGMGYKVLRLPEDGILTQEMINEPNTIYEIRYDFDLNGATIYSRLNNITLFFNGGSLSNGVISCINGTVWKVINPSNSVIFKNIHLKHANPDYNFNWIIDVVANSSWFLADLDYLIWASLSCFRGAILDRDLHVKFTKGSLGGGLSYTLTPQHSFTLDGRNHSIIFDFSEETSNSAPFATFSGGAVITNISFSPKDIENTGGYCILLMSGGEYYLSNLHIESRCRGVSFKDSALALITNTTIHSDAFCIEGFPTALRITNSNLAPLKAPKFGGDILSEGGKHEKTELSIYNSVVLGGIEINRVLNTTINGCELSYPSAGIRNLQSDNTIANGSISYINCRFTGYRNWKPNGEITKINTIYTELNGFQYINIYSSNLTIPNVESVVTGQISGMLIRSANIVRIENCDIVMEGFSYLNWSYPDIIISSTCDEVFINNSTVIGTADHKAEIAFRTSNVYSNFVNKGINVKVGDTGTTSFIDNEELYDLLFLSSTWKIIR